MHSCREQRYFSRIKAGAYVCRDARRSWPSRILVIRLGALASMKPVKPHRASQAETTHQDIVLDLVAIATTLVTPSTTVDVQFISASEARCESSCSAVTMAHETSAPAKSIQKTVHSGRLALRHSAGSLRKLAGKSFASSFSKLDGLPSLETPTTLKFAARHLLSKDSIPPSQGLLNPSDPVRHSNTHGSEDLEGAKEQFPTCLRSCLGSAIGVVLADAHGSLSRVSPLAIPAPSAP
ncbi:hypothetical protein O181_065953 [Austropuccinia psidii MF-1]|uniref:Uncharacterized protein n=1 Tax=Austropuccinia psidii MF-1 TaxID=1389203 RepID=A0A9Q3I342_9BASI|nr:hypothetical protein [Austropuccinia psidii MF-1]